MMSYTCGVFDMFHKGHKELLEMMEGKVVVYLHDDNSVYENKGKFPVQNYEHRKRNLLATDLVGHIIKVETADPSHHFDLLSTGTYYRGDDWKDFPGKDALKIPIIYKPYTEGISSTKLRSQL